MSPLLATYLNDHLAGATGGVELARRAAGSNRGTPYGDPLAKLAHDIEEDREALLSIMHRRGIGVDRIKTSAAWGAEKLGRLKLNGSLFTYSPLSRLIELEGLNLAVEGKLRLWQALALVGDDTAQLQQRARAQKRTLERLRRRAAAEALEAGGAS